MCDHQAAAVPISSPSPVPHRGPIGARPRRLVWPHDTGDSGGRQYFLLLVDDTTRFMWAVLLPTKGDATSAIKQVQAVAEKESGCKMRVLRTDNGGEFTATEFAMYCADEGIQSHFSAPYSP